jgi:hypothetical protein
MTPRRTLQWTGLFINCAKNLPQACAAGRSGVRDVLVRDGFRGSQCGPFGQVVSLRTGTTRSVARYGRGSRHAAKWLFGSASFQSSNPLDQAMYLDENGGGSRRRYWSKLLIRGFLENRRCPDRVRGSMSCPLRRWSADAGRRVPGAVRGLVGAPAIGSTTGAVRMVVRMYVLRASPIVSPSI